jgi:hypothetical protein
MVGAAGGDGAQGPEQLGRAASGPSTPCSSSNASSRPVSDPLEYSGSSGSSAWSVYSEDEDAGALGGPRGALGRAAPGAARLPGPLDATIAPVLPRQHGSEHSFTSEATSCGAGPGAEVGADVAAASADTDAPRAPRLDQSPPPPALMAASAGWWCAEGAPGPADAAAPAAVPALATGQQPQQQQQQQQQQQHSQQQPRDPQPPDQLRARGKAVAAQLVGALTPPKLQHRQRRHHEERRKRDLSSDGRQQDQGGAAPAAADVADAHTHIVAADVAAKAGAAARYSAGVRYQTDAVPRGVLPVLWWRALGYISLAFYMAMPLWLGVILVAAAAGSWPAAVLFAALAATLLLPAGPLMWPAFIEFAFLTSIRLYFNFSITLENPCVLEERAIWAGELPGAVGDQARALGAPPRDCPPVKRPGTRLRSQAAASAAITRTSGPFSLPRAHPYHAPSASPRSLIPHQSTPTAFSPCRSCCP